MLSHFLQVFVSDQKLKAVAVLILADIVFGVLAAFKTNTFKLGWLGGFLEDDVLKKVLPWFALYSFGLASSSGIGVAGVNVDFSQLADGAFVAVVAMLAASLYGSLKELGVVLPGGGAPAAATKK